MSVWAFDQARFVDEVLAPIRDGWTPDRDLFRTYLLPHDVDDNRVIDGAMSEIGRQLGSTSYRTYRAACELLRERRDEAAAVLTDRARRQAHRAEVLGRLATLAEAVRRQLDGAPALPSAEVARIARRSRGEFTRSAVRGALAGLGATEREPIDLPPARPPSQWATMTAQLAQLGHRSLWEYVHGVLGGIGVTTARLDERRGRLRVARNRTSAAEITLLELVKPLLADDGLRAVLRHEVVEDLTREAELGHASVARAAAALAHRLQFVGLPADASDVAYSVWCVVRFGVREPEPTWSDAYQSAVGERRLRGALEVLRGQPALPDGWAVKRDELAARLAALDDELARCRLLEKSDPEAAVETYLRLTAEIADPAIDAAITRCRPAPPATATARVDGGRITIGWPPSAATAGRVSYRVTRGDVVIADDVTGRDAVDAEPPGGVPLRYSVSALRDGNPSATAAVTPVVVALPEVRELELHGRTDGVAGGWRLPAGANGAAVTRLDGRGREVAVSDVHVGGFVDREARPGETHTYRVRARFRLPDGKVAVSAGVEAQAGVQETPVAVADLRAEFDGDEVVASWTPPERGEVTVLALDADAELPGGRALPVARVLRHGTPIAGSGGPGHVRGRAEVHGSRLRLAPVTVLGGLAAVGAPCLLDRRHGAVRGLRVLRLGSTVLLTWEWPVGSVRARVQWRAGTRPTDPLDPDAAGMTVTRVEYESRGVRVPVEPGEHWFAVCTMAADTRPTFGPLAFARESATAEASYRMLRGPVGRRARRTLHVDGPAGSELPAVVVVARSGRRPMAAADGELLLRVAGGPPPLRGEFVVPPELARPVHLRAFTVADQLVLIPTRPDELVVT